MDFYNILDARDKYVREFLPQDGAAILKGTCPDICPEKERYFRSGTKNLRWYEKMEGGRVNHKAAVKEYARSAADIQAPLSHELRAPHVLKLTMDQLLCNTIDRIDQIGSCGSMEDWYGIVESRGGTTDIR